MDRLNMRAEQNDRRDLADAVTSVEPFASCSRDERDLVCRLATLTDVPRGVEVCAQAEPGLNFYVVVQGEMVVTIDGDPVATLGPGCGFGEIALLTPHGRRVATVTTTSSSRLIVFSRAEFATLMLEIPTFVKSVMASCRDRLAVNGPVVTS